MPSSTLPPQPADKQADFWLVASASGHQPYTVRHTPDRKWLCDCKDSFFRKRHCRHITAAQGWFLLGLSGTHENPAVIDTPIDRKEDLKGKFQREIKDLKTELKALKQELKNHVKESHQGTNLSTVARSTGTNHPAG